MCHLIVLITYLQSGWLITHITEWLIISCSPMLSIAQKKNHAMDMNFVDERLEGWPGLMVKSKSCWAFPTVSYKPALQNLVDDGLLTPLRHYQSHGCL